MSELLLVTRDPAEESSTWPRPHGQGAAMTGQPQVRGWLQSLQYSSGSTTLWGQKA